MGLESSLEYKFLLMNFETVEEKYKFQKYIFFFVF